MKLPCKAVMIRPRFTGERRRFSHHSWRRSPFVRVVAEKARYFAYIKPRSQPTVHRLLHSLFESDLRRLNDTLTPSPLNGKYWVWGGLLLGWAREGQVLMHDDTDADFAVLDEDWETLERAVPLLERAGFRGHRRFRDPNGVVTELVVIRHGTRFEFFRMRRVGDLFHYSVYGDYLGEPVEAVQSVPVDSFEPFSFLGRTWMKVEHHERELEYLYGEWQIPVKEWSYIAPKHYDVERRPWVVKTSMW
jgi:hypothetical protein